MLLHRSTVIFTLAQMHNRRERAGHAHYVPLIHIGYVWQRTNGRRLTECNELSSLNLANVSSLVNIFAIYYASKMTGINLFVLKSNAIYCSIIFANRTYSIYTISFQVHQLRKNLHNYWRQTYQHKIDRLTRDSRQTQTLPHTITGANIPRFHLFLPTRHSQNLISFTSEFHERRTRTVKREAH